MKWNRLSAAVKTGYAGYFKFQKPVAGVIATEKDSFRADTFHFESLNQDYFESILGNIHLISIGLTESKHSALANMVLAEPYFSTPLSATSTLFDGSKQEITNLLLPGSVAMIMDPEYARIAILRDAAGFVPLYYHVTDDRIVFSSNLQTVRENSKFSGINTDKINEMLVYGHRTGKRTLWQNINTVSPGSICIFDGTNPPLHVSLMTPVTQYDALQKKKLHRFTEAQALALIKDTVDKALQPLEDADHVSVPCGGGVDSSLLGAYLAQRGQKVTFWCINQPDAKVNEKQWMDSLSRDLSIPVEYANLDKEVFLSNLISRLHQTHHPLVGPNSIGGIHARKLALEAGDTTFVSGEGADTVFGGLAPFSRLMPLVRTFRIFSKLSKRIRMQVYRGLISESAWVMDLSQVSPIEDLSRIALGDLERAELLYEVLKFPGEYGTIEKYADMLSWIQIKEVSSGLNQIFFEKDEFEGGTTHYPFAHSEMINLGLHLPYRFKVHKGHKKWLWRKFASAYIGNQVAFRRKYAFPTLTNTWLEPSSALLQRGYLEQLLCINAYEVFQSLPQGDPSRWTLLNIELWGRMHLLHQDKEELLSKLLDH